MTTPFEDLQNEFPIFQIKNKRNYTQSLDTVDGETIEFPAGSTQPVRATDLSQVPDITRFGMVVPSLKDLMRLGLFNRPADAGQSNTNTAE